MFENIGFPELLLIFVLALVIFGPQKLPQLGKSLGSALREFRRATREITDEISRAASMDEPLDTAATGRAAVGASGAASASLPPVRAAQEFPPAAENAPDAAESDGMGREGATQERPGQT